MSASIAATAQLSITALCLVTGIGFLGSQASVPKTRRVQAADMLVLTQ